MHGHCVNANMLQVEINDEYEVCIEFLKSAGVSKKKPVTEMMKISSNGMDVSYAVDMLHSMFAPPSR